MTPNRKATKKVIPTLESLTCIDSAEGMARRVLFDLEHCGLSRQKLAAAYKHDYQDGGYQYPNLIRLGQLLQELVLMAKSIAD